MHPDELGLATQVGYALQLALGSVFLAAAAGKVRRPRRFIRTVVEYRVLPPRVLAVAGAAVIAVEMFLAFAFLSGWLARVAVPLAAATLAAFAAGVGINLRRGRRIPCGCFGESAELISARSLLRIGILLAGTAAFAALFVRGGALTLDELAGMGLAALGYVFVLATVAASFVLGGVWLLHGGEAGRVLRRAFTRSSDAGGAGGDARARETAAKAVV